MLFEETVVDRYGLGECMPYDRVGKLCSWDGAMVLTGRSSGVCWGATVVLSISREVKPVGSDRGQT